MKSHLTLKRMLVHYKDKLTPQEKSGVVYHVPFKDWHNVYTGEMERLYGVRERSTREMLRHWMRSTQDQERKTH